MPPRAQGGTNRTPIAANQLARQAPHGYDIFKHKEDDCEKVVLKP